MFYTVGEMAKKAGITASGQRNSRKYPQNQTPYK